MGLPFKVATGYGKNEFIRINENEFDAALWAFKIEGKIMFENGEILGPDPTACPQCNSQARINSEAPINNRKIF